jgi:hypothetical protein
VRADIRNALKSKDDDYVKLLKRQAADVDTLLSAMGQQLSLMTTAYREELENVESVLMQVGGPNTHKCLLQCLLQANLCWGVGSCAMCRTVA